MRQHLHETVICLCNIPPGLTALSLPPLQITVPREFKLNGATETEQQERERKASARPHPFPLASCLSPLIPQRDFLFSSEWKTEVYPPLLTPCQALERRQRIILDMHLDAELLPEMRWPNRMPRGRVRPSPGITAEDPGVHAAETRASILRKTHNRIARRHGQYDFREER